ncbi:hypothetical protein E1B28_007135 [Marasmius oreades]|uniref:R3H domain-containing protein n=1 Tax=Marasmius oreades TaxID=181124 RepID=A0A9P7S103_9AGAR|nr:uncharacterized protein E1B28_007135 [Marasmius oreades]KAG7093459.1 hypothetical protein E1B28_007135 [Marasmius oreades]
MDISGSNNSILNPVAEPTRNPRQPRQPNRHKPRPSTGDATAGVSSTPDNHAGKPAPRRWPPRRHNKRPDGSGPDTSRKGENDLGKGRGPSESRFQVSEEKDQAAVKRPPGQGRRKGQFGGELTTPNDTTPTATSSSKPRRERYRRDPDPKEDDLTSNLIRALRNPPYADCPICFSSIHPPQPTWSCSPLTPIIAEEKAERKDVEDSEPQYCWTTFHLKCIRSWSEKSYNDVKAAWRARGEEDRGGEWRCPGCQGRRNTLTNGYWCFCGSTPQPNNRLATPHSCGNPCSRPRHSCSHPCSLLCHPGPCPPCKVTLETVCGCIRQQVLVVKCGENKDQHGRTKETSVSCGGTCLKTLNCGKHQCQQKCHLGECLPCGEEEVITCWCGKQSREGKCGEGDIWQGEAVDEDTNSKSARGFDCGNLCGKLYDCGIHACDKVCHPSSGQYNHCPLSPDRVQTCPCGKKPIAGRVKCTDPIPTCGEPCQKPHVKEGVPQCEHPCQSLCHAGPCPPCTVAIIRPCRCGSTTKTVKCGDLWATDRQDTEKGKEKEVLCDKPCSLLRACGRHRCNRVCCPMASFTAPKSKGKKKASVAEEVLDDALRTLHECDLVCGKTLTCGNHKCEERDHRGPCKPCLRSSFEELICTCGKTVLEPPVPCGTRVQCSFPCSQPPPPCGHQKAPHTCHPEDIPCPPCPFLTTKRCACGKKEIGNVKCSLGREKVGCGTSCGKLLGCGFHRCDRLCHAGDCGSCASMCGKSRKLCLPEQHPCTLLCHAPASCPEEEPCQSLVDVTCPCGRIRQPVHCGKSTLSPNGSSRLRQPLKCTTECGVAQRNARLADALGIKTEGRGVSSNATTYNEELVSFAKANTRFLLVVESAFTEFINSAKRTQVLPHMPPERRKFVNDLAQVYRLDTQMVDQEPHRSVQIIRRIDTRIPQPLLSAHIASSAPSGASLGKLGDLRAGTVTSLRKPSSSGGGNSSVTPTSSSTTKGWTSVVSRSAQAPTTSNAGVVRSMPTPPAVFGGPVRITQLASRAATPPAGTSQTQTQRSVGSVNVLVPVQPTAVDTGPVPDSWEDDA